MLYLKCTKLVQKYLGLSPGDLVLPVTEGVGLGNWYVHMFTALRRKHLIFMSERTLLSFIVCGFKKSHSMQMLSIFSKGLSQLLTLEKMPSDQIERVLNGYRRFGFANTDSRVSVGVMNDFVYHYRFSSAFDGDLEQRDVGETIQQINRMPQRTLNWENPIERMRRILEEKSVHTRK